MRRFRLRRLWRVNSEALMRAAGQNLKRLLNKRGWGRRPYPAEAVCAFFLAAFGWLSSRISSRHGGHLPDYSFNFTSSTSPLYLPDELFQRVFQQAGIKPVTSLKKLKNPQNQLKNYPIAEISRHKKILV